MKVDLSKLVLLAAAGFAALPAWSHHSTAMFDYTKTVTVMGTIKDFQLTNPHSYIQVLVPNDKGGNVEWSIEAGTPSGMARSGWTHDSLKPGDKVTVSFSPMRDGTHAGTVKSVTLADGKVLGGMGGRGGGPPGGAADGPPGGPSGGPPGGGRSGGPDLPTLERATPKQP